MPERADQQGKRRTRGLACRRPRRAGRPVGGTARGVAAVLARPAKQDLCGYASGPEVFRPAAQEGTPVAGLPSDVGA